MSTYLALLGQTPNLAFAELQAILPESQLILPHLAKLPLNDDGDARRLQKLAGGVVKIFRQLKKINPKTDKQTLADLLLAILLQQQDDYRSFALSELGRDHLSPFDVSDFKKQLKKQGVGKRFLDGSRHGLSAAVLLHQTKILELTIIQTQESLLIVQTVSVQDIDWWSLKDRQKPYRDHKKGMLPPKVARMMLNLALAKHYRHQDWRQLDFSGLNLYDPFCGSGTILLEGMDFNLQLLGSDLDKRAVLGAQTNLSWYQQQISTLSNYRIWLADVSKTVQLPKKIDLLVTEPYLGRPRPALKFLPHMFLGLEKMYLGAFKAWRKILQPGAQIVIVFPFVQTGKQEYNLRKLIDKLAKLGYTLNLEPVNYFRPQAIVKRQILSFNYL